MDDSISETVSLIASVAVVQRLVSFAGPLPIWCIIKKPKPWFFSLKTD